MEEKGRATVRAGIETQTIPIRTGSVQSNLRTSPGLVDFVHSEFFFG